MAAAAGVLAMGPRRRLRGLRSMVKSVLWFGRKYVVEIRGSVAKVPIERTSEKNALEESVLSSFDRSCCGAVWLCM